MAAPKGISIKRDPKSDVVCAEVLRQGVNGIVQIRAVAPLGPIRKKMLHQLRRRGVFVHGLLPNDPISISGHEDGRDSRSDGVDDDETKPAKKSAASASTAKPKPGQPVCNQAEFDKALNQVACAGLFEDIKTAATQQATHQLKKDDDFRKTKGKVDIIKRSHSLAKFAGTPQFQQCNGWAGVEEAFGRRRQAQHSAMMAKGITEQKATKLINELLSQDAQVVDAAKKIVDESATDDMEGD